MCNSVLNEDARVISDMIVLDLILNIEILLNIMIEHIDINF